MAKPEQAKDIKPKTEGEAGAKAKSPANDNMKVIIINLITTVLICVLFLSVSYVLQANLLTSKLAALAPPADASAEDGGESGDESETQKGFILDLGDFILNLSDVSPRKYLKVNVALEVSYKPDEMPGEEAAGKEGGKEGAKKEGGEGAKKEGGEGGASTGNTSLDAEMAQFKPAIRDAIITNLSSKTAAELSTVAGKELAKEQISEAVNGLFAGDREVIRVSFGEFIIQ